MSDKVYIETEAVSYGLQQLSAYGHDLIAVGSIMNTNCVNAGSELANQNYDSIVNIVNGVRSNLEGVQTQIEHLNQNVQALLTYIEEYEGIKY